MKTLTRDKEYKFKTIPNWSVFYYVFPSGHIGLALKIPRMSHYGVRFSCNSIWLHGMEYMNFNNEDKVFYVAPLINIDDFCSHLFSEYPNMF